MSFTVTAVSGDVTPLPDPGAGDLTVEEAAKLLGVPPVALARWASKLSFPQTVGGGETPRFRRAEIEALRDELMCAHSIEGAVRAARARANQPARSVMSPLRVE